jgi:uncharacterized protein (TIGR02145 family)
MKSFFYGLFPILLMLGSVPAFAQIGIGTKTPAPSAALEVTSSTNNKGILIPRITAMEKDAIASPAEGLLIYQTTTPIGFYYYSGSAWKLIANLTDFSASGNAGTATKLASAKNINGVAFDGSVDITVPAATGTLTGTTLKSTVTGSSLTSVGILANLTVTNPIAGSITGNAATATSATTVTTNANLTGDVTSVGNATTIGAGKVANGMIADNAVTTAKVANANVTLAKLENLSPGAIIVGNSSNRPTTVSISGDAVLSPTGELIVTTGAITTSKIATSAVATASIADGAITNAKVTDVAATKITGTLAVANGGTGLSTTPSNGQLDIGNGTGFTRATLTAGTGISITNTSGAVTIANTAVPSGATAGDMLYWNGSVWVTIPTASYSGQVLYSINNGPQWGPIVSPTDVINPRTGKIWMDRNLGATRVATSSTDADSYGDLYQWGRGADGHQIRTSNNTTSTLSSTDVPGNANFIIFIPTVNGINDWRNPQNVNLWQGVNGTNNPCPSGYRLPTDAELDAERLSWASNNNAAGAFSSPVKLPMAGFRNIYIGDLTSDGSYGNYWSSTVSGAYSRRLGFSSTDADMSAVFRGYGFSVRCLKELTL